MIRAFSWIDTPQGKAAELASLQCEFDDAASLLEDAIVRFEGEGRIGVRARRVLAELYRRLAACSLGRRDFDSALLHAQRSYDMAESSSGPLSPEAVRPLVLRSDLAWFRGAMSESKSTAERAYAVASQANTGPVASAEAFLRGSVLALMAGKVPDARAAATESARLSEDLAGTDAATYLGSQVVLARIKWAGNQEDEAIKMLAELIGHPAVAYFSEISIASAEMALSRGQHEVAATTLWGTVAMLFLAETKLSTALREIITRSTGPQASASPRVTELKSVMAHFGQGLLSS